MRVAPFPIPPISDVPAIGRDDPAPRRIEPGRDAERRDKAGDEEVERLDLVAVRQPGFTIREGPE